MRSSERFARGVAVRRQVPVHGRNVGLALLHRVRRLPPAAKAGLVALGLAIAGGCGTGVTGDSRAKDIFTDDASNDPNGGERRHKATSDERLWTISMNGCTGHLIAPDYMMSANHCQPQAGAQYTSGAAMVKGQQNDVTVLEVEEADGTYDYSIMHIKWRSGQKPPEQRFPSLIATKAGDLKPSRAHGAGDEIFTVGFPGDKTRTWGATYSEGRAKQASDGHLYYDMGIINGNSGGGVWRKSDHMLVSLTNGGAMILGQAGWDQANVDDANRWNFGPAMWEVYARSQRLQDLFPNGKNRFDGADGGGADGGTVDAASLAVALEQAPDDLERSAIFVGAPTSATSVVVCADAASACRAGASIAHAASLVRTTSGRAVFVTADSLPLHDGLRLTAVALDRSGKVLASRDVLVAQGAAGN
jgi:V8-like Glu-specific endopeptidase